MSCNSCNNSIIDDVCGCGTSKCKPFSVPYSHETCPPAPPIPPCGYRLLEDGTKVGVWHPIHPLIPRMKEQYPVISGSCDNDGYEDINLGRYLKISETYANTCRYPGDVYYQALMLRAASLIEYDEALSLYKASKASMIASGSRPLPLPRLTDTFYGQLLLDLERIYPANINSIFI